MGRPRLFEWTPLVKLGLIVYAFYLWHVTIFFIIARIDSGWNDVLRVVVAFGWTLGMALLSWFLLEKPLQRWVHRTEPRMRTEVAPDSPPSSEVVNGAEELEQQSQSSDGDGSSGTQEPQDVLEDSRDS